MQIPHRLAALAALVLVASLAEPARASAPAESLSTQAVSRASAVAAKRDGQIAFFSKTLSSPYLLKMLAFPGHRVRTIKLSFRIPSACCASPSLSWSPSGKRLAVVTGSDHNAIWTINPDGSRARRITPANGNFFNEVDWSPRGDFLTYTEADFDHPRDPHLGIYKARASGQGAPHKLVDQRTFAGRARWAPGGRRIVFVQQLRPSDFGVWIMNSDGSHKRRLFKQAAGCFSTAFPEFTASGERVVFEGEKLIGGRCRDGILQVSAGGGPSTFITSPASRYTDFSPLPAPAGGRILFSRATFGGASRSLITTVNGGRPSSVGAGFAFAWSPSGRWIIEDRSRGLYEIVHPDGSGRRTLLGRKMNAYYPAWQPR